MTWRTEPAWLCEDRHCATVTPASRLPFAPHPFDSEATIYGCPSCRETDLVRACDWDGCDRPVTAGTPTPDGYRNTCYRHRPDQAGGGDA